MSHYAKRMLGLRISEPESPAPSEPLRPTLHLSGTKLRIALRRLVEAAERVGGVERFAEAVRLKSVVFQERLGEGKARALTPSAFDEIVPLMATVRRRIGSVLARTPWVDVRDALGELIEGATDTTLADSRIARFEKALAGQIETPDGERGSVRFLRDLASEILHNVHPEQYPLMHRWVWDQAANTGVIRQIWHDPSGAGDDVDHIVVDVGDGYETHLMLREELSQFLADNGVFRDMLWHVDLLCAQIYGDYISAQGGAYLRADFVTEGDPLEHSRRILGLDRTGGRRLRRSDAIDADASAALETKPST